MDHVPAVGLGRTSLTRYIEVAFFELHTSQELATLRACAGYHMDGINRGDLSRGDEIAAFILNRIQHLSDPEYERTLTELIAQVVTSRIMRALHLITISDSVAIERQLRMARMPLDIPRTAAEVAHGPTPFHWVIPWVRHPNREAIFRGDFSVIGFRPAECRYGGALADGLIRAAAWFSAADISEDKRDIPATERWRTFLVAWHEWRQGTASMHLEPKRGNDIDNARTVMAFYSEFSVTQLLTLRQTLPEMTQQLGRALVPVPLESPSDCRRYLKGVVVRWRDRAKERFPRLEELFGSDQTTLTNTERYLVWLLATQTKVRDPIAPFNRLIVATKAYQLLRPPVPSEAEIHELVTELAKPCEEDQLRQQPARVD